MKGRVRGGGNREILDAATSEAAQPADMDLTLDNYSHSCDQIV